MLNKVQHDGGIKFPFNRSKSKAIIYFWFLKLFIHLNPCQTMTDKQSNELSMSKAVQEVLNAQSVIVETIPAFQTAKNELDSTLITISDAAEAQTKKITGNAEDKQKARKEAIDAALAIIGPAKSYARTVGNNTLFRTINYNRSDFRKIRHTSTVNALKVIRNTTEAIAADLADYGITATQIADFTVLINAYSSLVSAPRSAIT